MNNQSALKAVLVVFAVALVCSILVSAAAITLKPIQERNQLLDRSRHIVTLTGLVPENSALTDDEILDAVEQLDIRAVELDTGEFAAQIEPLEFDQRAAAQDAELGTDIPAALDSARLGRRSRFAIVYLVWDGDELGRLILPIHGQGMWSTLYGYLALESDLNTIAAVTFYQQAETAGLGDQVMRPEWHARWQGRQLYDESGALRFRVASGPAPDGDVHEVDGLTGATVTSDAVSSLIAYWFGPNGYAPFLDALRSTPPGRAAASRSQNQ
jgi:Na+-transporting NADH:ubiquinone oxidoreductase subunit C